MKNTLKLETFEIMTCSPSEHPQIVPNESHQFVLQKYEMLTPLNQDMIQATMNQQCDPAESTPKTTVRRSRDSFDMPQARYLLSEELLSKNVCISTFFHLLNSKRGRPRKDTLTIPDFQLLRWLKTKSDQLHARYVIPTTNQIQAPTSSPFILNSPLRIPMTMENLAEIRFSSGWAHKDVALMKMDELNNSGIIRPGEGQRRRSEKLRLLARFIHYVKVCEIIKRDEEELAALIGRVDSLTATLETLLTQCGLNRAWE